MTLPSGPRVKISAGKAALAKHSRIILTLREHLGRVAPNFLYDSIYLFADNTIAQEELAIYGYHEKLQSNRISSDLHIHIPSTNLPPSTFS